MKGPIPIRLKFEDTSCIEIANYFEWGRLLKGDPYSDFQLWVSLNFKPFDSIVWALYY